MTNAAAKADSDQFAGSAGKSPADTHGGAYGARSGFVSYLRGYGIELGAMTAPVDVRGVNAIREVRYVDRHKKADLIELFPELAQQKDDIVEADVTCDISCGLKPFENASVDFVIANHIIEHLPDPLLLMREIWRVLRSEGRCYLAVPDKRYTFDRERPNTSLRHLLVDHLRRVRAVDDTHLEEFIRLCDKRPIPREPAQRRAFFEMHRQRSIHVHVWDEQTFARFLLFVASAVSPFKVLGVSTPAECQSNEMIFMLEKTHRGDLRRFATEPMLRAF